jgi:hypothetical protein
MDWLPWILLAVIIIAIAGVIWQFFWKVTFRG